MKRCFFILCSFLMAISVFPENISGEWYRNLDFANGFLTINENMEFSIEVLIFAYSGYIEGIITKIENGYYISNITEDGIGSCKMTFLYHTDYIDLVVEGDSIGLGARAFFDGKYEKRQTPIEEIINMRLNSIIENEFDTNIIKTLLGDDLEYFTTCLATVDSYNDGNITIIEGWMPGVAPWQNGIIKIENNNIYILLTDCREETTIFKYYTNDDFHVNIPDEFRYWSYYNKNRNITKIGLNGEVIENYFFEPDIYDVEKTGDKLIPTKRYAWENEVEDKIIENKKNNSIDEKLKNRIIIIICVIILIAMYIFFNWLEVNKLTQIVIKNIQKTLARIAHNA